MERSKLFTKRRKQRQKENISGCHARRAPTERSSTEEENPGGTTGVTPAGNRICAQRDPESLASMISVDTAFRHESCLKDCSNAQPRQLFDETISPRSSSRLARRPQEHFPCALQPFRILPLPPGDEGGISVAEANWRLQQAQTLSRRQQHFDQLIDLASTGYTPARQCGQASAAQQQELQSQTPPSAPAPPRGAAAGAPNGPMQELPAVPQRLLVRAAGTTLSSRSGHGCIRILRME